MTVYVPGPAYVWLGLRAVDVSPSPKSHVQWSAPLVWLPNETFRPLTLKSKSTLGACPDGGVGVRRGLGRGLRGRLGGGPRRRIRGGLASVGADGSVASRRIAAGLVGRPRRPRRGRAPGRNDGRRAPGGGRGGPRRPGGVLAGRRLHGADRAWVVGSRAAGRRGQHRRVVVGPARVGAPRGIEHLTSRLPRRPDDAEGDPDGEQADDQGARDRQAAPSPPGPDRGGHRAGWADR